MKILSTALLVTTLIGASGLAGCQTVEDDGYSYSSATYSSGYDYGDDYVVRRPQRTVVYEAPRRDVYVEQPRWRNPEPRWRNSEPRWNNPEPRWHNPEPRWSPPPEPRRERGWQPPHNNPPPVVQHHNPPPVVQHRPPEPQQFRRPPHGVQGSDGRQQQPAPYLVPNPDGPSVNTFRNGSR